MRHTVPHPGDYNLEPVRGTFAEDAQLPKRYRNG
jgi:hypothetical protein